ncbi:hypothetical protein CR969_01790 [Candidatus Saccharibacteria bacterium]|nr:MAG: hypothetical protein CR969_01790 [Candidatus Saccharibacteria bacterium]
MKLFKLMGLGYKGVAHHKKQTILTVVIVGSLFSVLMALQFIVQGVENKLIKESSVIMPETYITALSCNQDQLDREDEIGKCSEAPEGEVGGCLVGIDSKPLNCGLDAKKSNDIFSKRAGKYNGEVVGNAQFLSHNQDWLAVYPLNIFNDSIKESADNKPKDTLPVVLNLSLAAELVNVNIENIKSQPNEDIKDSINDVSSRAIGHTFDYGGKNIFVAGVMPYGSNSPVLSKTEQEFRLLDSVLGGVQSNDEAPRAIYLDDGSKEMKGLLSNSNLSHYESVIKFKNLNDAYEYYKYENHKTDPGLFKKADYRKPEYVTKELITNKFQIIHQFKLTKFILSFANYVLLIVAVVVMIFTFLKSINQDNKLMALYRSLGAGAMDVFLIYFFYILFICVIAIVYALVCSVILSVVISYYYSADINASFGLFYGRAIDDTAFLVGYNKEIVTIIMIMLLSAPVVSLLTVDQLSMKNIAKRLKKQ